MKEDKRNLVIFGAWFFSDVIEELAMELDWNVVGRIDPEPPMHVNVLKHIPKDATCFVAIGDNQQRQYVNQQLHAHSRKIISLIHPSASVSKSAVVGAGSYIGENVCVRTGSNLGRSVMLNAGAVVSHHSKVGDFVTVGPNCAIASKSVIGSGTLMGAGSVMRPNCVVGKNCIVGAGAVVVKDVLDRRVVIGNPAKNINTNISKPLDKKSDWISNILW